MSHPQLEEILRRDPRFPFEAYEFIFHALQYTQEMLDRVNEDDPPEPGAEDPDLHISGVELCHGVRELALQEFGLLARTVFRQWGIHTTDDVGELVFNLIEAGLMSRTDQDRRTDFHNVFNLDQALTEGYQISGRPSDEDEQ